MIQTKIQFNLTNAKQYFREHLGAGASGGVNIVKSWRFENHLVIA